MFCEPSLEQEIFEINEEKKTVSVILAFSNLKSVHLVCRGLPSTESAHLISIH